MGPRSMGLNPIHKPRTPITTPPQVCEGTATHKKRDIMGAHCSITFAESPGTNFQWFATLLTSGGTARRTGTSGGTTSAPRVTSCLASAPGRATAAHSHFTTRAMSATGTPEVACVCVCVSASVSGGVCRRVCQGVRTRIGVRTTTPLPETPWGALRETSGRVVTPDVAHRRDSRDRSRAAGGRDTPPQRCARRRITLRDLLARHASRFAAPLGPERGRPPGGDD